MPDKRIREYAGRPRSVKPLLKALDRLEKREALSQTRLEVRARELLVDRFGEAGEELTPGFAGSYIGVHAEHTHYFNGFAVLLPLPFGTAIALRRTNSPTSRAAFDGMPDTWKFDASEAKGPAKDSAMPWMRVFEQMVTEVRPVEGALDVAVVSTVTPSCPHAYHTSLAVAVLRAVDALYECRRASLEEAGMAESVISSCLREPFGSAYPLATASLTRGAALIDTTTSEVLPLDPPPLDEVGFALMDVGERLVPEDDFFEERRLEAERALRLLQRNGFPELGSYRELEHEQLQRALQVLPDELVPVVRYLVTENRRVYRHVAALRRGDWQLVGALLLMGHASRRDDWRASTERADFVVSAVEQMSAEGMHGACLVDAGSCVLVAGRPFVVPGCLDRIGAEFEHRYGAAPEVTLL